MTKSIRRDVTSAVAITREISYFELTASEIVYYDRLKCCEDIDSMFPGEIFLKGTKFTIVLTEKYQTATRRVMAKIS